jgi:NAD(P)H-flavin reductase
VLWSSSTTDLQVHTCFVRCAQVGYVDFVIKLDAPDKTTLSDGRKMSHHLQALKPGDSIYLRGPHGTIEYKVCACVTIAIEVY